MNFLISSTGMVYPTVLEWGMWSVGLRNQELERVSTWEATCRGGAGMVRALGQEGWRGRAGAAGTGQVRGVREGSGTYVWG